MMSWVDKTQLINSTSGFRNSSGKSFNYTAILGWKWDEMSLVNTLQVAPQSPLVWIIRSK
jgi:hypothetical protein